MRQCSLYLIIHYLKSFICQIFTSAQWTHTSFSEVVLIKGIVWVSWVRLLRDGVLGAGYLEKVGVEEAESCYYELVPHLDCVGRGYLAWTMHGESLLLGATFILQGSVGPLQEKNMCKLRQATC